MIRYLLLSILILLVARAFWRVVESVIDAAGGRPGKAGPPTRSMKLRQDPVCGVYVSPATAIAIAADGGVNQYFCSERCRDQFLSRRSDRSTRAS